MDLFFPCGLTTGLLSSLAVVANPKMVGGTGFEPVTSTV